METLDADVAVLGGGPAGLTAAIYAARAALDVLVIEGEATSNSDLAGGQLMLTTEVENYPGFPDGVMGPDLVARSRTQAERFGARFTTAKVTEVEQSMSPFVLRLTTGDVLRARAVIVATGSTAKMLHIEDETRLLGHGLSTCATCDGFFFRGQDIAIVGGGDSALEEAIFLTKFARHVTVIHRREELRASKIMQDRAFANPAISFRWSSEVVSLNGRDKLEGVTVRDVHDGSVEDLPVTGAFLAIGHIPTSSVFDGVLHRDLHGYILTEPGRTATNVPGIFACGDVQDPIYRQAITSAGTGCMAAIDAERWLEASEVERADVFARTPSVLAG